MPVLALPDAAQCRRAADPLVERRCERVLPNGNCLIVSCLTVCVLEEWRPDLPIPLNYVEAPPEVYQTVEREGLEEIRRACTPEPSQRVIPLAGLVPPRPAREPRRARAARPPRLPRRPRSPRSSRRSRRRREPRPARPPRRPRDTWEYSIKVPIAGFWTQGAESPERRRRCQTSGPVFTRCAMWGRRGSLDPIVARFKGLPGGGEQELREWLETQYSVHPCCAARDLSACQQAAAMVLSTIATLTGWRPAQPPPRELTQEERSQLQQRLFRLEAQRRPAPSAPISTPGAVLLPRAPKGFRYAWQTMWPYGLIVYPEGQPVPPGHADAGTDPIGPNPFGAV